MVNIYACNNATSTSIIAIKKAKKKDKLLPIQFLNININPIKLYRTM